MDSKRKISEDVSENTSSDQSQSRALTTPKKELLPEQKARVWIDRELEEAGWKVVDRSEYTPDLEAAAIREVLMTGNKEADYILMLGGKAVAVVEAKKSDIPLDDPHLIQQAEGYTTRLLKWFPAFEKPLKLVYVSNGKEIAFRDFHVPNSEYEQIETFHRPKDIVEKLNLPGYFDGLPYLSPKRLRDCQYHAIKNLEKSFKEGKEKALIVLATGAGKTFTACTICYRMLSFTKARRILFLVDRNNLGTGAKQEFQSFNLTQTGKNFSEIFAVEKLGRQNAEDKAEDAKSLKSKEKPGKLLSALSSVFMHSLQASRKRSAKKTKTPAWDTKKAKLSKFRKMQCFLRTTSTSSSLMSATVRSTATGRRCWITFRQLGRLG